MLSSVTLCLALSLTPLAAQVEVPVLRTVGVHRVDLQAGRSQWLGPGGDPAWSPDGRKLYVEAQKAPLDQPPLGPLYTIAVPGGQAAELRNRDGLGLVKVSPSGLYLAAVDGSGATPLVVMLDARTGELAGPPLAIGALSELSIDAFAWAPAGDFLWIAGADGKLLRATKGEPAETFLDVPGLTAVWPSPDGRKLAIEAAGELRLLMHDEPNVEGVVLRDAKPDAPVLSAWWTDASDGVWFETAEQGSHWVSKVGLEGREPQAGWPLAGQVESRLGHRGSTLLYVAYGDGQAGLVQVNLETGEAGTVTLIDPAVPRRPMPDWRTAAPMPQPDGTDWAVTLGRTDRWGVSADEKYEFTDIDVSGKSVRVVRRGRSVGPSGVVFDARSVAYAGRTKPIADSPVAGDTRPGTMRWERPSPARWVVLHHTASRSDSGCLNSLTSPSSGKLAQLYADITPGSWMPAEPRTIGVHYLVLRSGKVLQLSEEKYITRHAGTGQWVNAGPVYDFNAETIGIEIVAEGNDFTPGQVRNVGRLVADICRRNDIPLEHVNGQKFVQGVLYHKDFASGLRGKPDPAGWPWGTMMQHAGAYLAGR